MDIRGKRIAVIGGAGFIGSHLVEQLLETDVDGVTVLDNLCRGKWDNLAAVRDDPRLQLVEGDLADREALQATVTGCAGVFHLAAAWLKECLELPRLAVESNINGTFNVLEAMRLASSESILLNASMNKVYGGMEDVAVVERNGRYEYRDLPLGVSEDRPLDFHSPYGWSKGAADQYVRGYA